MAGIYSNFISRLEERNREFDRAITHSRKISRSSVYRIIVLSAGIVGFSTSLFSIPVLQSSLELGILRYSWYSFLGVIILGFFVLMFEGRIKYAKTWKANQLSELPKTYDYSFRERVCAYLIVVASILFPANLIFNGVYEDENEKRFKKRVNGLVVHRLSRTEQGLIFLENIIFILFTCGLIFLVLSFKQG